MSKKRKIIQVLPALDAGGVECTVREIAAAVVQAGHESLIISAGGRMKELLEQEGSTNITMEVGKKSLSSFLKVRKMRALLRELNADIVHVHSRVPAWIVYLAWRGMNPSTRPRLLTTVHGFYSVNFYSRVMTNGERVITVSESAKKYVLDNYPLVDPEKVQAISLGVNSEQYYPGYKPTEKWWVAWRAEFPELRDKWVVCLPGRLTKIKGHVDFFSVVKELKEKGIPVHGLIVGEAHKKKKEYADSLKVMVSEMGLEESVTFTGHRTDLREVMAASDVILSLTNVPESFGRTTLESLALGKPTLGYAHGGVEEQLNVFLPEGKVPVNDAESAARLLESWYANPPGMPGEILPPYRLSDMTDAHLSIYEEYAQKREG